MAWMGARPLSKRIADEVAAEWDDAWRCFALDAESRLAFADEALAKAQGILSIVIESYPEVLGDLTTVLALTVLQELGEGYALMSEAWPIGREANPWMPDLAVVERNVRLTTVDSPSGQLSEIELTTPVSGGDGRDSSQPSRIVPVTEHKLAHDLAKAFSTYPTFLAVVAADRGRIELYKRRTETRRTACMGMSLLRRELTCWALSLIAEGRHGKRCICTSYLPTLASWPRRGTPSTSTASRPWFSPSTSYAGTSETRTWVPGSPTTGHNSAMSWAEDGASRRYRRINSPRARGTRDGTPRIPG